MTPIAAKQIIDAAIAGKTIQAWYGGYWRDCMICDVGIKTNTTTDAVLTLAGWFRIKPEPRRFFIVMRGEPDRPEPYATCMDIVEAGDRCARIPDGKIIEAVEQIKDAPPNEGNK